MHRLHFSEENNPGKYAVCTSQIFQKSSNTSRLKAKRGSEYCWTWTKKVANNRHGSRRVLITTNAEYQKEITITSNLDRIRAIFSWLDPCAEHRYYFLLNHIESFFNKNNLLISEYVSIMVNGNPSFREKTAQMGVFLVQSNHYSIASQSKAASILQLSSTYAKRNWHETLQPWLIPEDQWKPDDTPRVRLWRFF